jgi:hypothetical protein
MFRTVKIIAKVLLLELALASVAFGQAAVSGVVYDSVARAPLAAAKVQLVPADQTLSARTAVADSAGRYSFNGVADGRYTIGFFHPMLDSLGVDAPLKEVTVAGQRPVKVDLSIPSPGRLRTAVCADSIGTGGAVIGVVRDARTRAPMAGVTVEARWLELTIRTAETQRHVSSIAATTNDIGWFRLCNVPRPGTLLLLAHHNADSTDAVELQLTQDGFARGDLYLGAARAIVQRDTGAGSDTMPPRILRLGDGRLTGTVLTFPELRPLALAHVRIVGGHEVITNDRGEWTIIDAPAGTRTLEVRKVGYYPEQRTVNVIPEAPRVRVELSTMKAMLDTVRVRAIRLFDPAAADFDKRRNTLGFGKFLSPQDIERSGGFNLTDAFRMIPGVYVIKGPLGDTAILMRSNFSGGGTCEPAIFLDGHNIPGLTAGDIDGIVNRENVIGVEIYRDMVPGQFQVPMSGCGSIVIWTDRTGLMSKTANARRKPSTLRTGLFFVGAALAIFLITR